MPKIRRERRRQPKQTPQSSIPAQPSPTVEPKFEPTPTPPIQNREPRWGVRATIAVVAVIATVSSEGLGAWIALTIQARREQQQISQIGYAFLVQPAPIPGEAFETTGRWQVVIQIFNSGPVDARTVVLNLHTPPPAVFLHSAPELMSDAAAAKVEIKDRIPEGIYQVVINNLIKGDTLSLIMFYAAPAAVKQEFMERWRQGGMFEADFGKRFINHFFFTGEHLTVTNYGAMRLKPAFSDDK